AIEEAPIKANPFPSIGYLASARLAMIIIGLVGIFKHNPKLMTSAVVFFISAYFEALVQLLKHALLLWNGGSLMCTKRLQVSILDGCFWLDMACSVALMGQAIVPLVAAVVIAAESCVIFKESFESLVIADNEEKSKWSFSSVQDAVPTAFEPRTSSRRLSFGSPISNS
uniref:Uncharacterized protein n=1 Tax=Plectus sambesii TaxID=2011161 RepID=A0A914X7S2_9BILA